MEDNEITSYIRNNISELLLHKNITDEGKNSAITKITNNVIRNNLVYKQYHVDLDRIINDQQIRLTVSLLYNNLYNTNLDINKYSNNPSIVINLSNQKYTVPLFTPIKDMITFITNYISGILKHFTDLNILQNNGSTVQHKTLYPILRLDNKNNKLVKSSK